MIDLLGYGALVLNLISMSMKKVLHLRIFSLLANIIYFIYGIMINALPFIVGCGIATMIHIYHIFLIKKSNQQTSQLENLDNQP